MQQATDQVLIEALRSEFPEIYTKIKSYTVSAPKKRISDIGKIKTIIDAVKAEIKSSPSFTNWTGRNKMIHERQLIVAVVMMFYNPKRLFSVVASERTGLIKNLSSVTGIKRYSLTVALTKAISRIRIYEDFRNEVNRTYESVNSELNLIK